MKKVLIITSLVAALGASVAMAGPGGFMGKGADRMKEFLGLNDTQVSQVEVIMQEQKAKMDALREETDQRVMAVLTPEQATKFQEMKQKRQERMENRREHTGDKKSGGWGGF